MSRAERLLELMRRLRLRRSPAPGKDLAEALGISLRTLYRDISSLRAQGARIEGEPGIGYVLRPGFFLPPLMLTSEELEALALGARFVANRTDGALRESAVGALRKISSVLPESLRPRLDDAVLLVGPGSTADANPEVMELFRLALRESRKMLLRYKDLKGQKTVRAIWPICLGYFEQAVVLTAWCELRGAFRHFRIDRVIEATLSEERLPKPRETLFEDWRRAQGIPSQDIATDKN